ncbi:MAG: GNAT family N-acetyltransferase [Candidatus Cloacimonetes bacterium]|nr:GNAT family N-acetyltransferase [Candidatus Cloacimonadota bacterium]
MLIETSRLFIRLPDGSEKDIDMFFTLWNSAVVMEYVGFPQGLGISRDEVIKKIDSSNLCEFDRPLVVEMKEAYQPIGEAKMSTPDENGIARTDIKLMPYYWGQGFGKEIQHALVDYIFSSTSAIAVEATPNQRNIASCKVQEAVGAECIGESIYHFPENMRSITADVPYFIYRLYRRNWELIKENQ